MQKITDIEVAGWINTLARKRTECAAAIPPFLKPFHLASMAVQAKRHNESIVMPEGSDLARYASRMKLWEAIDQPPPVCTGERPAAGRFSPTRVIKNDDQVHQAAIDISEMFKSTGASDETCDSLHIMISELLGNTCAHSGEQSDIFGIVAGQVWQGGSLAQLCIADCGQGIRNSLSTNPDLTSDLRTNNACSIAVKYGVTGKPHGPHQGYGLTLTNDLTLQNNGCLVIASHDEYYMVRESGISTGTLTTPWEGTMIVFEWDINTPLDINSVYREWPKSPTEEEDDLYDNLFD
ncbi:hypothetical protein BZG82_06760 [Salinivibrio sp. PR5]|uniref:ATP-binding protein n=1 Tax=Salinivibrio sp. PR5 TaxID=1909484 RepID=UPI00098ACF57|nr:ATP-binding protein [Salinivibrio sp. PR5]OOF10761.1 hypothetical protein BZG82_06760 [Salinivibrio sp. PR5]